MGHCMKIKVKWCIFKKSKVLRVIHCIIFLIKVYLRMSSLLLFKLLIIRIKILNLLIFLKENLLKELFRLVIMYRDRKLLKKEKDGEWCSLRIKTGLWNNLRRWLLLVIIWLRLVKIIIMINPIWVLSILGFIQIYNFELLLTI